MAENDGGRNFTEGEAYALVESAVTRETAEAKAQVQTLTERLTAAETERDAAIVRATAAEADAAKAKTDHDEFVAEQERVTAMEAKRTERLDAVKAAAPKLEVSTERADRIVAMSDEAYAEMLETLRETAALNPVDPAGDKAGDKKPTDQPAPGALPRESAAFQGAPAGDASATKGGSVLAYIGTRRALRAS